MNIVDNLSSIIKGKLHMSKSLVVVVIKDIS